MHQYQRSSLERLHALDEFRMVAMGDDWATYVEERGRNLEFAVSLAFLKSVDLICFYDTRYEDAELTQRGYRLASELGFTDEPPGAYLPHCSEPTFRTEVKTLYGGRSLRLAAALPLRMHMKIC